MFEAITVRFVGSHFGLDLITVRVVVGQRGVYLCQVQVSDAITDLLWRQAELIPTDNSLHGNAGA